jgi:hypothetical protein
LTDKELVLAVHSDALCADDLGLYQIRLPRPGTALAYEVLSLRHSSEEEAWHFAAVRARIDQRVQAQMEGNRELVIQAFPKAFCAKTSGNYRQIRRPRLGLDKPATQAYVALSGRFSNEEFAWQDAANKLNVPRI